MFCEKCGAYNDDNSNNCSLCGNNFKEEIPVDTTSDAEFSDTLSIEVPNPPKTHFIFSVILSILGSVPFGITAIVLSVMSDVNYECENYGAAKICSKKSNFFCRASLIVGIIKWLSILFWKAVIK